MTDVSHVRLFDSIDESHQSKNHVALVSFEEMLLKKDPSIDLSTFVFLVEDERSKSFLQDARTGFSIYEDSDKHCDLVEKWSLSNPAMRRQLGIDF